MLLENPCNFLKINKHLCNQKSFDMLIRLKYPTSAAKYNNLTNKRLKTKTVGLKFYNLSSFVRV